MISVKESGFVRKPLVVIDRVKHPGAFYVADVVDTRVSFARNFGGYVRNDIAVINSQNNGEVVASFLDRLALRPSDGRVDVSDQDLRASCRSRYCQTPSEQISWIENMMKFEDGRVLEQAQKDEESRRLAEAREERMKLRDSLTAEEKEEIRKAKRSKKLKELIDE